MTNSTEFDDNIAGFKPYLGNENIKRRGVDIEWTPKLIKEFKKCAKRPIYFSEKYIKIVHVDRGLIPITMYKYQKRITRSIHKKRQVVVVTARQAGKTTTAVCVILHHILFNRHKTVALLADKGDTAREILSRIKIAYEALPKWLQQGVVEWNKGSVEFENGCKIIAASTSSTAIRGKSVSLLYIDEAAHVENWDHFFRAVFPTISSGVTTKILLTSTPNGLNHFYKTCTNAQKDGKDWNGYEYHKVMWHDVPGRNKKWKEEQLAALDWDMEAFAQEQECEFLGSSGTLITGAKLKQLVAQRPIHEIGQLKMYHQPLKTRHYVIICDVSRGKGIDYSAFSVIDITEMPYNQVAVFRDNMITPRDYAAIIFNTAKIYNDAQTLTEVNDIGEQVPCILYDDYEYDNILCAENSGRLGKKLTANWTLKGDKGIRTTKTVKNIGCSTLKLLVEQDQLIINDFNTISELSTFSAKGASYEAEPGNHDDIVMGLVLFGWMTTQLFFKELTDINTMNKLRDMNEEQIMDNLVPFGIIDDGRDELPEGVVFTSKGDEFLFRDDEF
jgi:hypothetical protein